MSWIMREITKCAELLKTDLGNCERFAILKYLHSLIKTER